MDTGLDGRRSMCRGQERRGTMELRRQVMQRAWRCTCGALGGEPVRLASPRLA